MLSDQQLLRYSRQLMLPKIDIDGQQALIDSHILILGLGGLGSPAAMYLASAGVGKLTLIDDDKVDLTNLQRQIIHQSSSVDMHKVDSARRSLAQLNADCQLITINRRLDEQELFNQLEGVDVVLDCSDNFATRFMLNRLCYQLRIPLVSGAAIRWEGQLMCFDMSDNTPCYRCVYDENSFTDQTCANNGVVSPLVGVIGSMQALEAIKFVTGAGEKILGRMLLFDGLSMQWQSIQVAKRKDCPVCSSTEVPSSVGA